MASNQDSDEKWEHCMELLQQISKDPSLIDDKPAFKTIIAKIYKHGRKQVKQKRKQKQQAVDKQKQVEILKRRTLIQQKKALNTPVVSSSDLQLQKSKLCYICKQPYHQLHHFYHSLCPSCGAFNYEKRYQTCDLNNHIVLITGGRIKIGFETALHCLRNGASVYVTTRFPQDALQRYKNEPDFQTWGSRLFIYGLDLRNLRSLDEFVKYARDNLPHLDILVNNAAQTIKRPLSFYSHLLISDATSKSSKNLLQPSIDLIDDISKLLDVGELAHVSIDGERDEFGQPIDYRPTNSWTSTLSEVDLRELLEVQLVNVTAPFTLCSQLKPLMLISPNQRRFIINVSAMEGQFQRESKTWNHPHTNMAKAALNMLTRTSASDYARDNIYMNSVDTGWITDENPLPKSSRLKEEGFHPPLDVIDGRSRILDPVFMGISQDDVPICGQFLKDFKPYPW